MNRSLMLQTLYFSSSSIVLCAFSALCTYSKFRHHPRPLGYPCAKFSYFRGLHCWASPWKIIVYSIDQSLSHSPRLSDAPGTELHLDAQLWAFCSSSVSRWRNTTSSVTHPANHPISTFDMPKPQLMMRNNISTSYTHRFCSSVWLSVCGYQSTYHD